MSEIVFNQFARPAEVQLTRFDFAKINVSSPDNDVAGNYKVDFSVSSDIVATREAEDGRKVYDLRMQVKLSPHDADKFPSADIDATGSFKSGLSEEDAVAMIETEGVIALYSIIQYVAHTLTSGALMLPSITTLREPDRE